MLDVCTTAVPAPTARVPTCGIARRAPRLTSDAREMTRPSSGNVARSRDTLMRPVRTQGIVKRRSRPAAKRARARSAPKTARATTAPAARRDIEGEIYARRKALADLMHSKVLGQADVSQAFKQITETAAEVLEVERASVWRLIDSGG